MTEDEKESNPFYRLGRMRANFDYVRIQISVLLEMKDQYKLGEDVASHLQGVIDYIEKNQPPSTKEAGE